MKNIISWFSFIRKGILCNFVLYEKFYFKINFRVVVNTLFNKFYDCSWTKSC
jgi:hypothetical protein